ncbi:hypothetical protein GQ44DRAFT_741359 [Phaeosphaeriaceae sp. PMI808]|nr:hypothetical protein GQ44DRAFT_741359 [Phaeosphaeriaceae sp. PMI808]
MGRSNFLFLLLCVLGLVCVGSTQKSDSLAKMPSCGSTCLIETLAKKICNATDTKCICTNKQFQSSVSLCVAGSCSIPEALVMQNASSTSCGAPVRDRGQSLNKISVVLIVLAGSCVTTRIAFKCLDGLGLGLDDWTILATTVLSTGAILVNRYGTIESGLGRDLWTLRPDQITMMLKSFYIMASLYFAELTALKLSLLFFYIKIFPTRGIQRLLWGTVIFTLLWGLIFVGLAIFQCRPISYFWDKWDGLHQGTCLDINAITTSNAGISIVLDFWSLGLPLWGLWGLNMHWKKKISVLLMFCVGTLVTVVSIIRIRAVVNFAQTRNVSWEFYDVSIWSTIEIGVGIICTCLPTLRLLFVKIFPVLGGSSARSTKQYHSYKSDNELDSVSKPDRSRRSAIITSQLRSRSPTSTPREVENGINVRTSVVVKQQSREMDKTSLVSHDEIIVENQARRYPNAF